MIDRMVRHGAPAGLSTVAYQSSTLVELAVRNRINAQQRAVSEYQIIKHSLSISNGSSNYSGITSANLAAASG